METDPSGMPCKLLVIWRSSEDVEKASLVQLVQDLNFDAKSTRVKEAQDESGDVDRVRE